MQALHASRALLPGGWADAVRIGIDPQGSITEVEPGGTAEGAERVAGVVLPGMVDLHSHAFQRAMAGLAERLVPGESSFWSWRETMYAFLARIGPEEQRAIAAQLFVEKLKAGYTATVEFHYLHNRPDGGAYDDPAELSLAVIGAARATGIGLTHLPVLYMAGGFGGRPLEPGQRRFALGLDAFADLYERLAAGIGADPQFRLGFAPHSLRAVPEAALVELDGFARRTDPAAPFHVHVAEQPREVRDCLEWCGRRPVAHLLAILPVDARFCCVHATHMDDGEVLALARSGAVAGLCPTTEANLGDGPFELAAFLEAGGTIGIGADSNVSVSPIEELRWLDYGQRLGHLRRCVAASEAEPHTGARLWRAALAGGAQAAGRPLGAIAPGRRADLLVLDPGHPALHGRAGDALLDSLVFAGNTNPVQGVMVGGVWRVREGRHPQEAPIAAAWRRVVDRLR